jgi:hypothetical protein
MPAVKLMVQALALALNDSRLAPSELDGIIALPSLMSDQHFMMAHAVAQQVPNYDALSFCMTSVGQVFLNSVCLPPSGRSRAPQRHDSSYLGCGRGRSDIRSAGSTTNGLARR